MSLPLAALLLFARVHMPLATAMTRRPARGIVVILGLTVSLWHIAATKQWSAFLTHFSNVLQSQDGIIAWDTVAAPPASRQAKLAAKMVWPWTNPDLSLVAGIEQIWAVGPPCSLSWRGGSESDRVPPDLDQRLGLAPKPIAKR